MRTENSCAFCFDLHFDSKWDSYLPVAYVVPGHEASAKIAYVDKKATPAVLESLGISVCDLDSNLQKLLSVCELLKPEKILQKFGNTKTRKTVEDVLKDRNVAHLARLFLANQLHAFLELLALHEYPLSLNLGANKDFDRHQLRVGPFFLEAQLQFDKTENGISYTLLLKEGPVAFYPSHHKINLLLNEPAWLEVDQKLFRLQEINTKKVLPFLKKKTIAIPEKMVPEYFEKFIKDIVRKVAITANGFSVLQKNKIISCRIETVHDFFKNQYDLNLIFDYDGFTFASGTSKTTHATIDLTQLEHIKVVQFKRDQAAETVYEKRLLDKGFAKTEAGFFRLPAQDKPDAFACLHWLIENQEQIIEEGFSLENIKAEGKKIVLRRAKIQTSQELKSDWFDIKMTVFIGEMALHFTDFIPYLRTQNQLYLLPDGSYFLIPIAWMSRYASLAKLATVRDDLLQLPKSNFAVLDTISDSNIPVFTKPKRSYRASPLVKATLRPYQEEGVQWLLEHYENQLGACLADDMGLGKTLQTLATLVAVQEQLEAQQAENVQYDLFGAAVENPKEYLKALIVLPSSLVFNWYNEARKFTPHFRRIQYVGQDRKMLSKKLAKYDLIFTSYAVVSRDISLFEKYDFRYLILDESQYIKNKDSKIYKAISRIPAANRISLSGTPIENSLSDLWSQLHFINPNVLGSYAFFVQNYKIPIEKKQDATCLLELQKLIQPFILRRTKLQVLKDLPEMSEQYFYCDMEKEQEKLYEEEKSKARNFLLKTDGPPTAKINIINTLMRLRQLSNHPKMIDATSEMDSGKYSAVTHYLETLIQSGQKALVFSSFVTNLAFYTNWCTNNKTAFCMLTGATPAKEREQQVALFQNEQGPLLFFISLKAGGVGLNLTQASYVLFLDPWWNPFAEKQGVGRAHRIGQLRKVNVIRFVTKNTIEEKIVRLQESKLLLSDSLLDENQLSAEIEANLEYLLS